MRITRANSQLAPAGARFRFPEKSVRVELAGRVGVVTDEKTTPGCVVVECDGARYKMDALKAAVWIDDLNREAS